MTPELAKLTRFAIFGLGVLLVILFAVYLATHKFVTLNLVNPDSIVATKLTVKGSDDKQIPHIFGLYTVARSQSILKVSVESGEETIIATKPLPFVALQTPVELKKLRQADIYTSKSLGCNTYDDATDSILTRRCATAAGELYRLDSATTKPWGNVEARPLALGLFYYNYLNGVMTLTTADANERLALEYNAAGLNFFKLDDKASKQFDTDLAVDLTDQANPSFAVYSATSGDVAYYTVRNQKAVSVKEYSPPKSDTNVRSRCTTAGQTVFCLRGALESPFGHHEEDTKTPPTIVTAIDFSQAKPLAKSYEIKSSLPYISDIYTDSSKTVYVKNNQDLYRLDGDTPVLVYPGVAEVASGQKLVFTTTDHIYRLDTPTTARKIFSKANLTVSTLSSYGSVLLFDVLSNNDRLLSDSLTFKIQDTPASSSASIASLLPLSDKNLPITSATFAKNKLQIQPETFYTSDRATGTFSYDKVEYEKNKAAIVSYFKSLEADGKLPQGFEILFTE